MANMNSVVKSTCKGLAVPTGSPGSWKVSGAGVLVEAAGGSTVPRIRRGPSPEVHDVLSLHGFFLRCVFPYSGTAKVCIPIMNIHQGDAQGSAEVWSILWHFQESCAALCGG